MSFIEVLLIQVLNVHLAANVLPVENTILIFTCGFPELVTLCMVICRKNPHSCKDAKKATPLDSCR